MMYEWSAEQKDLVLITGHTHQPVFESLTHIERLQKKKKQDLYSLNKEWAEAIDLEVSWTGKRYGEVREDYLSLKPTYFNSGCCCFNEGDITGIEIMDGMIRLIKWSKVKEAIQRSVLEEKRLVDLINEISNQR